MEGIYGVKFGNVDQINPDAFPNLRGDRPPLIFKTNRVDGIDFVAAVEVGIKPIHDHHKFAGRGASLTRINNEGSIQAFMHVSFKGQRVAVI